MWSEKVKNISDLFLQTISQRPSSSLECHLQHTILEMSEQVLELNQTIDKLKKTQKTNPVARGIKSSI
jgi:hypothetical protein